MNKIRCLCAGLFGKHIKDNMENMQTYQDNKHTYSIFYKAMCGFDDMIMRLWTKLILPIYFKLAGRYDNHN
jgi:hypothetical protein